MTVSRSSLGDRFRQSWVTVLVVLVLLLAAVHAVGVSGSNSVGDGVGDIAAAAQAVGVSERVSVGDGVMQPT